MKNWHGGGDPLNPKRWTQRPQSRTTQLSSVLVIDSSECSHTSSHGIGPPFHFADTPMLESLSALLFHVRPRPQGDRHAEAPQMFTQTPLPRWDRNILRMFPPSITLCRDRHMSSVELKFSEIFKNNRFKVDEAIRQIVEYSPSRIQWESKPGANLFQMTTAALTALTPNPDAKFDCVMTGPKGLRFSCPTGTLDVALSRDSAVFTAYAAEPNERILDAAVDSIAVDVSNNVRSYSYSSSSGFDSGDSRIFDRHNPFGEMESIINHFFGAPGHMGSQTHEDNEWDGQAMQPTQPNRRQMTTPSGRGRVIEELEGMGVQVILPQDTSATDRVDWSSLAGYEKVKSQVEESVILSLKHPSLFGKITAKTRAGASYGSASNRPKVVLFEGPPGTGKSSTARIIANETNVPMIHIPLESVVSKWFGESEKQMARIYELARELAKSKNATSIILFIDEIDSLVSSRDIGSPHEASKRILSVLLRQIDGFTAKSGEVQSTLICATNRKKDLDKAFLNRVDSSIHFGLPNEDSRFKILKLYAQHLSDAEIRQLASITEGLPGRSLKDLCQSAERHWTASFIRGLRADAKDDEIEISPPPVDVYTESAKEKFTQQIS